MELNSQKDLKTVLGINKAMPATNTFSGNKHLRSSTHNGQLPIQFTNLGQFRFSLKEVLTFSLKLRVIASFNEVLPMKVRSSSEVCPINSLLKEREHWGCLFSLQLG